MALSMVVFTSNVSLPSGNQNAKQMLDKLDVIYKVLKDTAIIEQNTMQRIDYMARNNKALS